MDRRPGRLQSMGSQRIEHHSATKHSTVAGTTMGVGAAIGIKGQEVRGWGRRPIIYTDTEITKN